MALGLAVFIELCVVSSVGGKDLLGLLIRLSLLCLLHAVSLRVDL